MATAPKNCRWTDLTESRLVDFAIMNRSEAGDGMSFKKAFWAQAAAYISSVEVPGKKFKSGKACGQKFGHLKGEFLVVKALKELSGIHWDEKKGFNIGASSTRTEGTALEVFEEYVKKHPAARKYKRKGFPLYEAMFDLMPSRARGANVFRPLATTSTPPTSTDAGSPSDPQPMSDDDEEDEPMDSQEWPISPPPSRHCSPSITELTTPPRSAPPAKKGRVIPILELSNQLGKLTDAYCHKSAPSSTLTPTRQRAIEGVESDSNLNVSEKVSLLNAFMKSSTAVSIYTALPEGSEIRTAWA